jgi:hypothetical protein
MIICITGTTSMKKIVDGCRRMRKNYLDMIASKPLALLSDRERGGVFVLPFPRSRSRPNEASSGLEPSDSDSWCPNS